MARSAKGKKGAKRLKRYWSTGAGGAKIRWGSIGDYRRCVKQTKKYLGAETKGYCANLHKRTTGKWPHGHRRKRRR